MPSLSGGGAERVAATLLKHLDWRRFDLSIALVASKGCYAGDIPDDVRVFDLKCSKSRHAVFKLVALVRQHKPDVVFSSLGYLNLLIMLARPLMPKETVFIGRETNIPSINIHQSPYPKLFSFLYPLLYPKFDRLVCQSQDMKNDLTQNLGLDPKKTVVINNPVDVEWIAGRAREHASGLKPGAFNLLAAGKLMYQKGFDLLLQAFAKLDDPRFYLTILGRGKEEAKLKALAQRLGIKDRVTFAGFVENPYPFMAQADLFVLSSRFEGFPNVVLESCACGTPVAAFDCLGGLNEIIREGVNGWLVEKENVDALTRAVKAAVDCPLNRESVIRSVSERFGVARIIGQYEALFETVAKG